MVFGGADGTFAAVGRDELELLPGGGEVLLEDGGVGDATCFELD